MSFFKKIFLLLAVVGAVVPSFALAQYGLEGASQGTGLIKAGQTLDASTEVPNLIGTIVGVALSFVGAIFFLLILYAGFLWMTSFGSSEKADKAKGILEHAAIGLLIVLSAYAISRFVFSNLPGGSSSTATTPATNANNACEAQYPNGVCQDNSFGCAGQYVVGLCPGAANIQCCTVQAQL